jgi:hypothetical protein
LGQIAQPSDDGKLVDYSFMNTIIHLRNPT